MEYKPNKLFEYIKNSEIRIVNDNFKVRLSRDLAKKYDNGDYKNALQIHIDYINAINKLGLKYPGNANPVFYMYIVPDNNFIELLNFPFTDSAYGGKPVKCFDIDGFHSAYGISQNLLDNQSSAEPISSRVNGIHELAHLVHGQFFNKDRILAEGFAETLPLYTMGLQNEFDEHAQVIKNMTADDIISPNELLAMGRDGTFGRITRIKNKSASFDWSYISSYLFVRGYIMKIAEKFELTPISATQKFLEIVRSSEYSNQFLIFDLANAIDIPGSDLLKTKTIQLLAQKSIQ